MTEVQVAERLKGASPQVFEYNDPVDYLQATLQAMQSGNARFSLRAWASQIGLPNVAMLSMVLSRKRRLLPHLASRIAEDLQKRGRLNESESRYLNLLVLFSIASSAEEKAFYQDLLSSLRPDGSFSCLELDQLRVISDWHHLAIVEMTQLQNFSSDPRWISLRLGGNVSQGQVIEAIERLIRLGLLEREANGALKKTSARFATPSDTPSQTLRSIHLQMIRKAQEALEHQAVEKRDITGHLMVTSREKIPEAKKMIRAFRLKLSRFLDTPGGDSLYQLNVQLFDLLDTGQENLQ